MAVSTIFYGNPLISSLSDANFQQFREPVGGEEYLEEQNSLGQVGKIAHIKTNGEPYSPLKGFDFRKAITSASKTTSKDSCTNGIIAGIAASLFTKNPLPLLLGLSECFPKALAQQKVGGEFQVNSFTNSSQTEPSIASFGNDSFVVTWSSNFQDGSERGIYGQLFDRNGTKIGSEFQVNTYTTNDQYGPTVASLSNGNFVVTWHSYDQDGSSFGVFGQLFNNNSTKIGNEFQVNTYTFGFQSRPSLASLLNGSSVVTWHSNGQDGSNFGIFGQLFTGNATKIGSEFQVNNYTSNGQEFPIVASFPNNNFVVTWRSHYQDNSSYGVFGQLFSGNASKVGDEFQINTYISSDQSGSSVASFNDGNFIVTWYSYGQDGSNFGIFGQLFTGNATKIGSEFQVNTFTPQIQFSPMVASFNNGNFIVTWHSSNQDGSGYGVYGQLFNGNASKLGREFQINTFSTNDQLKPSVASLSNGNFVVTWESDGQDGDGWGIIGQIFSDHILTSSTTSTTISTTTLTSNFNPSSSIRSPTVITTTSPSSDISEIISPSSPPQNRFLWLWLLLGITGGITCLGLTGYYLSKKRKDETSPSDQRELQAVEDPTTNARRHESHKDADYKKLSDIRGESTEGNYANRPKKDRSDSDYANRPKREKMGPEYANRPQRADRESQYANVAGDESESSETEVVPGEV